MYLGRFTNPSTFHWSCDEESSSLGDNIRGKFIPGGTNIGHSIWSAQRNPVYGNNPDLYRPERWVEASADDKAEMDKVVDLVFGYGRWGCLGKSIARMELNKVFVEVSGKYSISHIDGL
jgi:cytochrome P450